MPSLGLGLYLGAANLTQGGGFNIFADPAATVSGDGSVASPYTLAQLTALSGSLANKRIGLKRGSVADATTVTPRLELSDAGVVIGAYGAGDKPRIDCSALISGDWTNVATNVWQKTVTQISNSKASGNIFRNGLPMQLVQNRAGLVADNQAFVAAWGWAGTGISQTSSLVIEIYSTVQPSGDGYAYRYSKDYGVRLTGEGVKVQDLIVEGSTHQDGNIVCAGAAPVLERVVCKNGSRHGCLVGPNFIIRDSEFLGGRNRQENGGGDHIVCNTATFGGSDAGTLERVTFDAMATGNGLHISADNIAAFLCHDNSNNRLLSVTATDCTFKDGSTGFNACGFTTTVVDPILDNAKRLFGEFSGSFTLNVEGATGSIGHVWKTNASSGTQTLNTQGMNIEIESSLVSDTVKAVAWSQNAGLTANWVSQSDTVVHPTASGSRQLGNLRKGKVTCYDGQFAGATQLQVAFAIAGYSGGTGGEFEGDRNTYKTGVTFQINGDTSLNFASWQSTVSPQDANSTTA